MKAGLSPALLDYFYVFSLSFNDHMKLARINHSSVLELIPMARFISLEEKDIRIAFFYGHFNAHDEILKDH